MSKEINEKTFELNITNQLLNISKSYLWYIINSPICHFMPDDFWLEFLTDYTFFAEGLTQAQETNPNSGGYDVSINFQGKNGNLGRLLFLQYKSGTRASFCKNNSSKFHGSQADKKPHIIFKFNEAADNTQHSTLRNLSSKPEINAESVLYVFPRITEKSEFLNNIDNILQLTSFVPVLEIDNQANAQTPPISIIDGVSHNYRTSYDGIISEVNYYYFPFNYDNKIISNLLAELVCVQIERFFRYLKKSESFNSSTFNITLNYLLASIKLDDRLKVNINKEIVFDYLKEFSQASAKIPKSPQKYTTEIPKEGLKFKIEEGDNYSGISYQMF